MIKHLEDPDRRPRGTREAVAFVYCDYQDLVTQTATNLISSLVWQLARKTDGFPPSAWTLRKECKSMNRKPSLQELLALLKDVVQGLSKAFVVVDALDESSEVDEQDADQNHSFLEALHEISRHIHLMVTAKPLAFLKEAFHDAFCTEISASTHDLELYAQHRWRNGTHFGSLVDKDPHLRRDIIATVCSKARGMLVNLDLIRYCLAKG